MSLHRRMFLGGAAALSTSAAFGQSAANSVALRVLVAGGVVALIRHAEAPGIGDPPRFRLGDCSTQRNLSEEGRRQAADVGRKLREAGVLVSDLRSSRWCRAIDTAKLMFPDVPVAPDAALDSFFAGSASGPRQTEKVRFLMNGWRRRQGVLALVTHQVNITALTRIVPAEGEIVVIRPGIDAYEVVGRLRRKDGPAADERT